MLLYTKSVMVILVLLVLLTHSGKTGTPLKKKLQPLLQAPSGECDLELKDQQKAECESMLLKPVLSTSLEWNRGGAEPLRG